jgi:hypothetical protein
MRIKIRGMMVLVAASSLAFGFVIEQQARSERDDAASGEAVLLGQVVVHERGLSECRRHLGVYYDWFERESTLNALPYQHPGFSRWDEEAAWHEAMIGDRRRIAADYSLRKERFQRRLIFP